MTTNDVIALARAGFTAGQIATIAQSETGGPKGGYQQNAQTNLPYQMSTPQGAAQGNPLVAQPEQQTMQTTSVTASPYLTGTMDANSQMLMAAINNLTNTMQAQALRTDMLPKEQTAGDVIASIINPPGEVSMPESSIMSAMGRQTVPSGIQTTVRGNY